MAPVAAQPEIVDQLHLAADKSAHQHPDSTHPERRYGMMLVGLETGSIRLFRQFMKGKSYPYRPEQWPDVTLKGMEVMNRANWFPMCTFILGLPGETDADMHEPLDLLHSPKGAKWRVIPTLFAPLEDTRLESRGGARIARLTDLQRNCRSLWLFGKTGRLRGRGSRFSALERQSAAQRRPMSWERLPGSFLSRLDARTYLESKYQEPPRSTLNWPVSAPDGSLCALEG